MLEDLHDMLQKDPDAQVVANCMSVLLEVRAVPNFTSTRTLQLLVIASLIHQLIAQGYLVES